MGGVLAKKRKYNAAKADKAPAKTNIISHRELPDHFFYDGELKKSMTLPNLTDLRGESWGRRRTNPLTRSTVDVAKMDSESSLKSNDYEYVSVALHDEPNENHYEIPEDFIESIKAKDEDEEINREIDANIVDLEIDDVVQKLKHVKKRIRLYDGRENYKDIVSELDQCARELDAVQGADQKNLELIADLNAKIRKFKQVILDKHQRQQSAAKAVEVPLVDSKEIQNKMHFESVVNVFADVTNELDDVKEKILDYYGTTEDDEYRNIMRRLSKSGQVVKSVDARGSVPIVLTKEQYEDYIARLRTQFEVIAKESEKNFHAEKQLLSTVDRKRDRRRRSQILDNNINIKEIHGRLSVDHSAEPFRLPRMSQVEVIEEEHHSDTHEQDQELYQSTNDIPVKPVDEELELRNVTREETNEDAEIEELLQRKANALHSNSNEQLLYSPQIQDDSKELFSNEESKPSVREFKDSQLPVLNSNEEPKPSYPTPRYGINRQDSAFSTLTSDADDEFYDCEEYIESEVENEVFNNFDTSQVEIVEDSAEDGSGDGKPTFKSLFGTTGRGYGEQAGGGKLREVAEDPFEQVEHFGEIRRKDEAHSGSDFGLQWDDERASRPTSNYSDVSSSQMEYEENPSSFENNADHRTLKRESSTVEEDLEELNNCIKNIKPKIIFVEKSNFEEVNNADLQEGSNSNFLDNFKFDLFAPKAPAINNKPVEMVNDVGIEIDGNNMPTPGVAKEKSNVVEDENNMLKKPFVKPRKVSRVTMKYLNDLKHDYAETLRDLSPSVDEDFYDGQDPLECLKPEDFAGGVQISMIYDAFKQDSPKIIEDSQGFDNIYVLKHTDESAQLSPIDECEENTHKLKTGQGRKDLENVVDSEIFQEKMDADFVNVGGYIANNEILKENTDESEEAQHGFDKLQAKSDSIFFEPSQITGIANTANSQNVNQEESVPLRKFWSETPIVPLTNSGSEDDSKVQEDEVMTVISHKPLEKLLREKIIAKKVRGEASNTWNSEKEDDLNAQEELPFTGEVSYTQKVNEDANKVLKKNPIRTNRGDKRDMFFGDLITTECTATADGVTKEDIFNGVKETGNENRTITSETFAKEELLNEVEAAENEVMFNAIRGRVADRVMKEETLNKVETAGKEEITKEGTKEEVKAAENEEMLEAVRTSIPADRASRNSIIAFIPDHEVTSDAGDGVAAEERVKRSSKDPIDSLDEYNPIKFPIEAINEYSSKDSSPTAAGDVTFRDETLFKDPIDPSRDSLLPPPDKFVIGGNQSDYLNKPILLKSEEEGLSHDAILEMDEFQDITDDDDEVDHNAFYEVVAEVDRNRIHYIADQNVADESGQTPSTNLKVVSHEAINPEVCNGSKRRIETEDKNLKEKLNSRQGNENFGLTDNVFNVIPDTANKFLVGSISEPTDKLKNLGDQTKKILPKLPPISSLPLREHAVRDAFAKDKDDSCSSLDFEEEARDVVPELRSTTRSSLPVTTDVEKVQLKLNTVRECLEDTKLCIEYFEGRKNDEDYDNIYENLFSSMSILNKIKSSDWDVVQEKQEILQAITRCMSDLEMKTEK